MLIAIIKRFLFTNKLFNKFGKCGAFGRYSTDLKRPFPFGDIESV
jgi:hypothetical protein